MLKSTIFGARRPRPRRGETAGAGPSPANSRAMPKAPSQPIVETDLYSPIAELLTAQGYAVRSEVRHCDITAVRGEELVVVELKRSFSIELLIQATRRQRITEVVYVALPRPKWSRRWVGIKHLLRRLELGLILVSLDTKRPQVEIAFHPLPFARKRQRRAKTAVLREIESRSGDFNTGGSSRRKLMTAYRENALHVACCLEGGGPQTAVQLRAQGTGPKTYSILYRNVYGWFERVAPATYDLTAQGREEMGQYPEVVARWREVVAAASGSEAPEPGARRSARTSRPGRRQENAEVGAK